MLTRIRCLISYHNLMLLSRNPQSWVIARQFRKSAGFGPPPPPILGEPDRPIGGTSLPGCHDFGSEKGCLESPQFPSHRRVQPITAVSQAILRPSSRRCRRRRRADGCATWRGHRLERLQNHCCGADSRPAICHSRRGAFGPGVPTAN